MQLQKRRMLPRYSTTDTMSKQKGLREIFLDNVDNLFKVVKDMENPFQEETGDLLSLDTKDIAHQIAAE